MPGGFGPTGDVRRPKPKGRDGETRAQTADTTNDGLCGLSAAGRAAVVGVYDLDRVLERREGAVVVPAPADPYEC
jgi:hypothetical protein